MSNSSELEGSPFVVKTYQLVDDGTTDELVGWSATQDSFIVWNPVEFAAEILPKYFKHNNFCSFIRQLNTYNFHKVESNNTKQWEFKHELFQKGQTQILKDIQRKKSKKRGTDETQYSDTLEIKQESLSPNHNILSFVSTSPDEASSEVYQLKAVNNQLVQEVLRLKQQQNNTEGTLEQILKNQMTLQDKVDSLSRQLRAAKQPKHLQPSPPSSPSHSGSPNSPLSPPNFVYDSSTSFTKSDTSPSSPSNGSAKLSSFLDENLLGLEDLAHLELTSSLEQELVSILTNSQLSPSSPSLQLF